MGREARQTEGRQVNTLSSSSRVVLLSCFGHGGGALQALFGREERHVYLHNNAVFISVARNMGCNDWVGAVLSMAVELFFDLA